MRSNRGSLVARGLLLAGVAVLVAPGVGAEQLAKQFVGISGLYAFESFDGESAVDDSWGASLRVSKPIQEYLALELQVDWFEAFETDDRGAPPGDQAEFDGVAATGNLRAYMPGLSREFSRAQPYVLGGVGLMNVQLDNSTDNDFDETDLVFRVGAGFDLPYNERASFNFDVSHVLPTGDVEDFELTTVSGGLQFHWD